MGMWFAIFWTQIIDPIFFCYTMNTNIYLTVIGAFVNQLTKTEQDVACQMQP
jgi:hypothetical protein